MCPMASRLHCIAPWSVLRSADSCATLIVTDVPEHVEIVQGEKGLTKVVLKHSSGASAEVSNLRNCLILPSLVPPASWFVRFTTRSAP